MNQSTLIETQVFFPSSPLSTASFENYRSNASSVASLRQTGQSSRPIFLYLEPTHPRYDTSNNALYYREKCPVPLYPWQEEIFDNLARAPLFLDTWDVNDTIRFPPPIVPSAPPIVQERIPITPKVICKVPELKPKPQRKKFVPSAVDMIHSGDSIMWMEKNDIHYMYKINDDTCVALKSLHPIRRQQDQEKVLRKMNADKPYNNWFSGFKSEVGRRQRQHRRQQREDRKAKEELHRLQKRFDRLRRFHPNVKTTKPKKVNQDKPSNAQKRQQMCAKEHKKNVLAMKQFLDLKRQNRLKKQFKVDSCTEFLSYQMADFRAKYEKFRKMKEISQEKEYYPYWPEDPIEQQKLREKAVMEWETICKLHLDSVEIDAEMQMFRNLVPTVNAAANQVSIAATRFGAIAPQVTTTLGNVDDLTKLCKETIGNVPSLIQEQVKTILDSLKSKAIETTGIVFVIVTQMINLFVNGFNLASVTAALTAILVCSGMKFGIEKVQSYIDSITTAARSHLVTMQNNDLFSRVTDFIKGTTEDFITPLFLIGSVLYAFFGVLLNSQFPTAHKVMTYAALFARAAIGFKSITYVITWIKDFITNAYFTKVYGMTRDQYQMTKTLPDYENWLNNLRIFGLLSTMDFANNAKVISMLDSSMTYGLEVESTIKKLGIPKLVEVHTKQMIKLRSYYIKSLDSPLRCGISRITPMSMNLYGPPGVGKTSAVAKMVEHILAKYHPKEFKEQPINKLVYSRNVTQEFWDAFTDQVLIVKTDDFAQRKDTISSPNPEYLELIQMMNSEEFSPHMAALENKGYVRFKAHHILSTSNSQLPAVASLVDAYAVHRRRDLCFTVTVKPQFAKADGRVDETKLPQFCVTCDEDDTGVNCSTCGEILIARPDNMSIYDFTQYEIVKPSGGGSLFARESTTVLSFDQVMAIYGREYRKKLNAYNHRLKLYQTQNGFSENIERDLSAIDNLKHVRMQVQEIESFEELDALLDEAEEATETHSHNPMGDFLAQTLQEARDRAVQRARAAEARVAANAAATTGSVEEEETASAFVDAQTNVAEFDVQLETVNLPTPTTALRAPRDAAIRKFIDNIRTKLPEVSKTKTLFAVLFGIAVGYMSYKGYQYFAGCPLAKVTKGRHMNFTSTRCKCDDCAILKSVLDDVAVVTKDNKRNVIKTIIKRLIVKHGEDSKWSEILAEYDMIATISPTAMSGDPRTVAHTTRMAAMSGDPKTVQHVNRMAANAEDLTFYEKHKNVVRGVGAVVGALGGAKIAYDCVKSEKIDATPQNSDFLEALMKKNQVHLKSDLKATNGLFIFGTTMIVNIHAWNSMEGRITVIKEGEFYFDFEKDSTTVTDIHRYNDFHEDLIAVTIPNIPHFKDITNCFVRGSEIPSIVRNAFTIQGYTETSKGSQVFRHHVPCVNQRMNSGTIAGVTYFDLYYYDVDTLAGYCGSPLVASGGLSRIFAIHIAGGRGTAFAQPLTYDMVMKAKAMITAEMQVQDFDNLDYVENRSPIFQPSRTELSPSVIAPHLEKPTTKPAHLKPFRNEYQEIIDPLLLGIKKYDVPKVEIPQDLVDIAANDIWNMYEETRTRQCRVLSYEEALVAKGFTFLQPIVRKTSPGLPYLDMDRHGMQGKRYWFGHAEEIEINQEIRQDVEEILEKAKTGIPKVLWITMLKDERRPIEKVDKGKTRVFTVGNMAFNIAVRMLFGDWIDDKMCSRIMNESATGMNVYSIDVLRMYTLLKSKGNNIIAGDFSNFDGTQPIQFHEAFVYVINQMYDDNYSEQRINLARAMFNPLLVIRDEIYQGYGINTSGNPVTVHVNDFVNSMGWRVAFLILKQEQGLGLFCDFRKYISLVTFGDDNVGSVNEFIADWFNQKTLTVAMSQIGFTYTDENKSTSEIIFRDIHDVSFLKRKFVVEENGYPVFPIDKGVIFEMIKWDRKTKTRNDKVEAIKLTITSALMEAALHGEIFYVQYVKDLRKALKEEDIAMQIPLYKEQRSNILIAGNWIEMQVSLRNIGEGAFGRVVSDGSFVRKYFKEPQTSADFIRMYRIMDLHHANVIRIVEINTGRVPYIRMPACELPVLIAMCRYKFTIDQVGLHVICGIDFLHYEGFIHCDIKPDNIMFDGGYFKLIDIDNALREVPAGQEPDPYITSVVYSGEARPCPSLDIIAFTSTISELAASLIHRRAVWFQFYALNGRQLLVPDILKEVWNLSPRNYPTTRDIMHYYDGWIREESWQALGYDWQGNRHVRARMYVGQPFTPPRLQITEIDLAPITELALAEDYVNLFADIPYAPVNKGNGFQELMKFVRYVKLFVMGKLTKQQALRVAHFFATAMGVVILGLNVENAILLILMAFIEEAHKRIPQVVPSKMGQRLATIAVAILHILIMFSGQGFLTGVVLTILVGPLALLNYLMFPQVNEVEQTALVYPSIFGLIEMCARINILPGKFLKIGYICQRLIVVNMHGRWGRMNFWEGGVHHAFWNLVATACPGISFFPTFIFALIQSPGKLYTAYLHLKVGGSPVITVLGLLKEFFAISLPFGAMIETWQDLVGLLRLSEETRTATIVSEASSRSLLPTENTNSDSDSSTSSGEPTSEDESNFGSNYQRITDINVFSVDDEFENENFTAFLSIPDVSPVEVYLQILTVTNDAPPFERELYKRLARRQILEEFTIMPREVSADLRRPAVFDAYFTSTFAPGVHPLHLTKEMIDVIDLTCVREAHDRLLDQIRNSAIRYAATHNVSAQDIEMLFNRVRTLFPPSDEVDTDILRFSPPLPTPMQVQADWDDAEIDDIDAYMQSQDLKNVGKTQEVSETLIGDSLSQVPAFGYKNSSSLSDIATRSFKIQDIQLVGGNELLPVGGATTKGKMLPVLDKIFQKSQIRDKLYGYAFVRCDIKVRVEFTIKGLTSGIVYLAVRPLHRHLSTSMRSHYYHALQIFDMKMTKMHCNKTSVIETVVPFMSQYDFYSLADPIVVPHGVEIGTLAPIRNDDTTPILKGAVWYGIDNLSLSNPSSFQYASLRLALAQESRDLQELFERVHVGKMRGLPSIPEIDAEMQSQEMAEWSDLVENGPNLKKFLDKAAVPTAVAEPPSESQSERAESVEPAPGPSTFDATPQKTDVVTTKPFAVARQKQQARGKSGKSKGMSTVGLIEKQGFDSLSNPFLVGRTTWTKDMIAQTGIFAAPVSPLMPHQDVSTISPTMMQAMFMCCTRVNFTMKIIVEISKNSTAAGRLALLFDPITDLSVHHDSDVFPMSSCLLINLKEDQDLTEESSTYTMNIPWTHRNKWVLSTRWSTTGVLDVQAPSLGYMALVVDTPLDALDAYDTVDINIYYQIENLKMTDPSLSLLFTPDELPETPYVYCDFMLEAGKEISFTTVRPSFVMITTMYQQGQTKQSIKLMYKTSQDYEVYCLLDTAGTFNQAKVDLSIGEYQFMAVGGQIRFSLVAGDVCISKYRYLPGPTVTTPGVSGGASGISPTKSYLSNVTSSYPVFLQPEAGLAVDKGSIGTGPTSNRVMEWGLDDILQYHQYGARPGPFSYFNYLGVAVGSGYYRSFPTGNRHNYLPATVLDADMQVGNIMQVAGHLAAPIIDELGFSDILTDVRDILGLFLPDTGTFKTREPTNQLIYDYVPTNFYDAPAGSENADRLKYITFYDFIKSMWAFRSGASEVRLMLGTLTDGGYNQSAMITKGVFVTNVPDHCIQIEDKYLDLSLRPVDRTDGINTPKQSFTLPYSHLRGCLAIYEDAPPGQIAYVVKSGATKIFYRAGADYTLEVPMGCPLVRLRNKNDPSPVAMMLAKN